MIHFQLILYLSAHMMSKIKAATSVRFLNTKVVLSSEMCSIVTELTSSEIEGRIVFNFQVIYK